MALDVQRISLDISKQPTPQQVRLGQGDANATQLVVSIFDDGVAYSLDGYSVRLLMRLPNNGGYYDVDGTRSGNVATFDIDETYAASVHGYDGYGYIDVMDGETVICSTSRFQLVVLQCASDGVELSAQYSDAVNSAVDRATAAAEAAEGVVLQDVPLMSATIRGGAQLGTGLEITDGVLSVDSSTVPIPTMSASVKGGAKLGAGLSVADDTLTLSGESYTSAEKSKLAGIEANANNYALPTMGASTKGGAKLGSGLTVSDDTLSLGSHVHAAGDITSGQLAIANGGTGASTAETTTTASDFITPSTGITVTGAAFARWGKVAQVLIRFTYSSDISVPANGNIADVGVGTISSGKRPITTISLVSWGNNVGLAQGYINSSGDVKLCGLEGTGAQRTVDAGTQIDLTATYILA